MLCSPLVLALPDPTKKAREFIVDSGANEHAIGCCHSLKVVYTLWHMAAKTVGRERNYCTTRKELLTLLNFVKRYRYCLIGCLLRVRTDH